LLVPVFLGNQWLNTIPLIQVLAFYGAIISLQTNHGAAFLALAKPKVVVMLGIVQSVILISLLLILTRKAGPVGAAWAFLATALVLVPVRYAVLVYYLKLHLIDIVDAMWRPLAAAAGMLVTVNLVAGYLGPADQLSMQIAHLGLTVMIGAAAYPAYLVILWRLSGSPDGAEATVLRNVLPALKAVGSLAPWR
jgi:PST family polysaccharide transporter